MKPTTMIAIAGAVLMLISLLLIFKSRASPSKSGQARAELERESSKRWASEKHLKERKLLVDIKDADDPRRLLLGWIGRKPVLNPSYRSLMVQAPTGAGKTPRVVVPVVLRHRGPALVASVKSDVLALTSDRREEQGPVFVFDPTEGRQPTTRWSIGAKRTLSASRRRWMMISTHQRPVPCCLIWLLKLIGANQRFLAHNCARWLA